MVAHLEFSLRLQSASRGGHGFSFSFIIDASASSSTGSSVEVSLAAVGISCSCSELFGPVLSKCLGLTIIVIKDKNYRCKDSLRKRSRRHTFAKSIQTLPHTFARLRMQNRFCRVGRCFNCSFPTTISSQPIVSSSIQVSFADSVLTPRKCTPVFRLSPAFPV